MSNVLEHVEPRIELLGRLARTTQAARMLVRVPVLDRDWTVPLRKELGLPYFSEPTHVIEYDPDSLRAELAEAGLEVVDLKQVWGELWVEARPAVSGG